MKNISNPNSGFTLVEMAVVMVIVGLLIGLGSAMIGPMMSLSKTRETKEFLGGAVESVNSWAASNNRIPTFNPVLPDTIRFDQIVKSPIDTWGRPFIYLYDANLAPSGANSPTKDTICGRRTTPITISNISITPAVTISNVAYVVFSLGDDATPNTLLSGTFTAPPNAPVIFTNALISTSGAISATAPATTATITIDANNSDIVRWVTLDELRSKIGCQGAQLKIVNNELPPGSTSTVSYSTIINADGGVPFTTSPNTYKWCVEINNRTTLPGGLVLCSTNTNPCTGTAPIIRYTQSSQNCSNLPETGGTPWPNSFANLYITSGMANPTETGSFSMNVYARDNNNPSTASVACNDTSSSNDRDSCTSKAFVLTVNP